MQRDIDRAGRLLDRLVVPRVILRSILLAIALFSAGALGMWLYAYSNRPEVLVTFFGPGLPAVAALLAVTVAILRTDSALAVVLAALTLLLPLAWIASGGYGLAVRLPASWHWILPAAFRLAFLSWLAFEVAVGVLSLLRTAAQDRRLASEPRLLPAVLGAPPALGVLAGGRRPTWMLFVASTFFFVFGALQAIGLLISPDVTWSAAQEACGFPDEATRNCFAAASGREFFGQLVVWPATFIGSIAIARILLRRARLRTRDSAAAVMARDEQRAPILFLRAFENDQVELRRSPGLPLARLLGRPRSDLKLDYLLVEEFAALGPTIALGRPADLDADGKGPPSFGVWRHYARHEDWQEAVRAYAAKALAIVMVVDERLSVPGKGVAWEVEHLAAAGHLSKTLLLVPPDASDPARNAQVWRAVATMTGLQTSTATADGGPAILARFIAADGTLCVATSQRFTVHDYLATLRWFFDRRGPRSGAPP